MKYIFAFLLIMALVAIPLVPKAHADGNPASLGTQTTAQSSASFSEATRLTVLQGLASLVTSLQLLLSIDQTTNAIVATTTARLIGVTSDLQLAFNTGLDTPEERSAASATITNASSVVSGLVPIAAAIPVIRAGERSILMLIAIRVQALRDLLPF